jgi:hypothetical protein
MPALVAIVVVAWLVTIGVVAAWTTGAAGLIGGAVLGLAGVAFLQSLYPVEPRVAPGMSCDSPEVLRFRLDGNGLGVLPWVLAAGSTIAVAIGAGVTHALPIDAVAAVVAVLGAGLWVALGQVGPFVEIAVGAHHLSIRRGWVRLGAPRLLPWDDVGCAVLAESGTACESELVVEGGDGPLIRTGLRASPEDLYPLVAEIEAQLARRRESRTPAGCAPDRRHSPERRALERLLASVAR